MTVLTPQRLLNLSTAPRLHDYWYLIAAVTLTVCNRPHDIPKIYHYALHLKENHPPSLELYHQVLSVIDKYQELNASSITDYSPYNTDSTDELFKVSEKFRESILKASALSGLPKSINSMMKLREVTPLSLRPNSESTNRPLIESYDDYTSQRQRGEEFWSRIYSKVSGRVINQLNTSYPDLWQHTINNVYSPLLSYTGILNEIETSIIVVSCLIPQDVNPQLKGHLKGALNNGVELEVIRAVRKMCMDISSWCGVEWKTEVAKL